MLWERCLPAGRLIPGCGSFHWQGVPVPGSAESSVTRRPWQLNPNTLSAQITNMSRMSPWQQPQRSSRLGAALAAQAGPPPEAGDPHPAVVAPPGRGKRSEPWTLRARPLLREAEDRAPCREHRKSHARPWVKADKGTGGRLCRGAPTLPRESRTRGVNRGGGPGSCQKLLWKSRGGESKEGVTVPAHLGFVVGNPESLCGLIYWSASYRSRECICDAPPPPQVLWQTDR